MGVGKKTGGRVKGSINKRNALVEDIAAKFAMDPFEILMRIASGDWQGLGYKHPTKTVAVKGGGSYEVDVITLSDRAGAAREAAKYLHSQKQSIAHTTGDEGFKVIIEDYSKKE